MMRMNETFDSSSEGPGHVDFTGHDVTNHLGAKSPSYSNDQIFPSVGDYDGFHSEHNGNMVQYCPMQMPSRKTFDHIKDKELRKKLKNRESAQAARDRKKAKMVFLEGKVSELAQRNKMLEEENRALRKWQMNVQARFGLLKEQGDDMAAYENHYQNNVVVNSDHATNTSVFTLPSFYNEQSDADVYGNNALRSDATGTIHTDVQPVAPPYSAAYYPIEYGCSAPCVAAKFSDSPGPSDESLSSGDASATDCQMPMANGALPDYVVNRKQFLHSARGYPGFEMREGDWPAVGSHPDSTQRICIGDAESVNPYHLESPERVLHDQNKEKHIFPPTVWEGGGGVGGTTVMTSYQRNHYGNVDSVAKQSSTESLVSGTFIPQQNLTKSFAEENFVLEVR